MKKLMLFIFAMVLISGVSAELIGPFQQGELISLPQICDDCTYNTITTVLYPNGSTAVSNVAMDQNGTYWNYSLHSNFTDALGTYIVNGEGDLNGVTTVWAYDFLVTRGGVTPTTPQIIMYAVVLAILLILFLGSFIWMIRIPWGHYTNSEGVIVEVNKERTKKLVLFFLSYIFMLLFLFIGKSMTENFMFINDTPVFFNVFFNILLVAIAPLTIAIVAMVILTTIADSKLQEAIFRGLEIR